MLIPYIWSLIYGGLKFKTHYGQHAEDVMVRRWFRGVQKGFYIDIGAHHPYKYSNTAHLWLRGWKGINVDASASAIKLFNKIRTTDINICAAIVSPQNAEQTKDIEFFYGKDLDAGATCDPTLAAQRDYKKSVVVKTMTIKQIMAAAVNNHIAQLDYLNIDIEGLDSESIDDISNWPLKPKVITIEIYAQSLEDVLQSDVSLKLSGANYIAIEKSGPTTVFIHKDYLEEIQRQVS